MQLILANPTERDLVRARMDAENDWLTQISAAREEGLERGLEEGHEIGRAEGRAEGQIKAFAELVRDGILPLHIAAQRAGYTDAEFEKLIDRFRHDSL